QHLEVDDVGWAGELEELRGGPHRAAAGDVLEDRDRRAEPAAPEQRAEARAELTDDGEAPRAAVAVVLESVEGERVHGYAPARITRPAGAPVPSTTVPLRSTRSWGIEPR